MSTLKKNSVTTARANRLSRKRAMTDLPPLRTDDGRSD
jgi:hypothetical protein